MGLVAALFVYETVALWRDGGDPAGDTITAIMRRWFANRLVLFAFGMLAGHFVWCG